MSAAVRPDRLSREVVIPVRWQDPPVEEAEDFRASLVRLVQWCEVTIVDGSTDGRRIAAPAHSVRWIRHHAPAGAWGLAPVRDAAGSTSVPVPRPLRGRVREDALMETVA